MPSLTKPSSLSYCRLSFEQNKLFTLCLRATKVRPIYSREAGSEFLCFFLRDTQKARKVGRKRDQLFRIFPDVSETSQTGEGRGGKEENERKNI